MRKISIILTSILLLALFATNISAAKKKTFQKLSLEVLESLQSFYPVRATEMGIHHYDHRFTDYSNRSVKNMLSKLKTHSQSLYKYKGAKLSTAELINYKLLKSNVDITILDLKRIKWHTKSPQLYVDEATNGLYYLMISEHAPIAERVVTIIDRMRAVPALFATAQKNIKNPPPTYIESAQESLESGMRFYQSVAGELMKQFPERADMLLKVSTAAREAMNDFSIFLSEVTPGAPTSFAIGKDNLDYMLTNEYFLNFDSDSLLKIGESLLAETNKEYQEYKKYVESEHQNGADSVYVPIDFSRQDILDYYDWEVNQVRLFVQSHKIVNVPEDIAPIKVIETPPFLRSMHGGIAYNPAPPFDSVKTGYFYVRPVPEDLDRRQLEGRYRYVHRRGFKGSVVHEAYPGHHLQMQLAAMNRDPVRKWQTNLMMIEGWALYSEQMMYEKGLFGQENPSHWLAVLGGIRYRAARIVVDVKLHTGQFTYDECVAWMNDVLEIDNESGRKYINTEVRRYTLRPTIQMSYLMGKREITRLLDAYKAKHGPAFDLGTFHDALLAEGSIPPALLWNVLGL